MGENRHVWVNSHINYKECHTVQGQSDQSVHYGLGGLQEYGDFGISLETIYFRSLGTISSV